MLNLSRRSFLGASAASYMVSPASAGLLSRFMPGPQPLTPGNRFAFEAQGGGSRCAALGVESGKRAVLLDVPHAIGGLVVADRFDVLFATDPNGQGVTVVNLQDHETLLRNDLGLRPDVALKNGDESGIAYGGHDGAMSLWSLRQNIEIARFDRLPRVENLTFNRRGCFLCTTQSDHNAVAVLNLAMAQRDPDIVLGGAARRRWQACRAAWMAERGLCPSPTATGWRFWT